MAWLKSCKAILVLLLLVNLEYIESSKLLKLAALAMILRSAGLQPYPIKAKKHKEYHCDKDHDKPHPPPDKDWDNFNDWKEPSHGDEHEHIVENRPHKTYVKPEDNRRNNEKPRSRPKQVRKPSRLKHRPESSKRRRKPESHQSNSETYRDEPQKDQPEDYKPNDQDYPRRKPVLHQGNENDGPEDYAEDDGNETYDEQQPVSQKYLDEQRPEPDTEIDEWQDAPEEFHLAPDPPSYMQFY